jgi:hypothetical protein
MIGEDAAGFDHGSICLTALRKYVTTYQNSWPPGLEPPEYETRLSTVPKKKCRSGIYSSLLATNNYIIHICKNKPL